MVVFKSIAAAKDRAGVVVESNYLLTKYMRRMNKNDQLVLPASLRPSYKL